MTSARSLLLGEFRFQVVPDLFSVLALAGCSSKYVSRDGRERVPAPLGERSMRDRGRRPHIGYVFPFVDIKRKDGLHWFLVLTLIEYLCKQLLRTPPKQALDQLCLQHASAS